MKGKIHIGTSGWHYPHWRGRFYPAGLPEHSWLPYYAEHFGCVEINASFYRLPTPSIVEQWLAQTPEDFVFTLKASRYISHMKKLKDCARPLAEFLAAARRFADRLGAILVQLPPHWRANPQRLADFLGLLPGDLRFAMEFRDPSWHTPKVYELLEAHGIALCQFDLAGVTSPAEVTTDLVYLRLHGPDAAYAGSYAEEELTKWATRLRAWAKEGREVYVFFDNDEYAYAVDNANTLQELLKT
jgi:uncharacterized protein YecE (DUF72 family)